MGIDMRSGKPSPRIHTPSQLAACLSGGKNPSSGGRLLYRTALLVPKEMKVEHSGGVKDLTDEQLEAMIEHLKSSLEAQAQSAKVIEGEAEVVPSLPAPARPRRHREVVARVQSLQKSLNRSGAISVYRTVC